VTDKITPHMLIMMSVLRSGHCGKCWAGESENPASRWPEGKRFIRFAPRVL